MSISTPALTRQVVKPPVRLLYKLIAVVLVSTFGTLGLGIGVGSPRAHHHAMARAIAGIDCGR